MFKYQIGYLINKFNTKKIDILKKLIYEHYLNMLHIIIL
jgi:hypothetical protein